MMFEKVCVHCGEHFRSRSVLAKYCPNLQCKEAQSKVNHERARQRQERVREQRRAHLHEKVCPVCGKTFMQMKKTQRFCTDEACTDISRRYYHKGEAYMRHLYESREADAAFSLQEHKNSVDGMRLLVCPQYDPFNLLVFSAKMNGKWPGAKRFWKKHGIEYP